MTVEATLRRGVDRQRATGEPYPGNPRLRDPGEVLLDLRVRAEAEKQRTARSTCRHAERGLPAAGERRVRAQQRVDVRYDDRVPFGA